MMHTKVGRRIHRATIIELDKTGSNDSGNNKVSVETDRGKRWSSIRSSRGFEFVSGNQVHAETTHIVEMDSDPLTRQITAEWRITVRSRTFEVIEAPDYDFPERMDVRLGCRELVGGV